MSPYGVTMPHCFEIFYLLSNTDAATVLLSGQKLLCSGMLWFKNATPGWGLEPGTVYPKKYAHGFVVLCFVVVMQSFIMNSHKVFIHIHQGCFAGTVGIVRLPQCQWSKPDGYGEISQCITTTKHSKAKTVCIFLGIYCRVVLVLAIMKHYETYILWFLSYFFRKC